MNRMDKYEQETIIIFNENDGEAEIYTASPRVAKVLISRGLEPYKTEFLKGKKTGWFFKLPRHSVILNPSNKIIRIGGRPKRGGFGLGASCNSLKSLDAKNATNT